MFIWVLEIILQKSNEILQKCNVNYLTEIY